MAGDSAGSGKLSKAEISRRIRDLGEWFQNIDLNGVITAPGHFLGDYPANKWKKFSGSIPRNLSGWTVLDIGCNAGFYSIEMKRRGASRVVGIDNDEGYLAQARFAAEICGIEIEFREMSVYEIADLREKFDLVLFLGVLYHLRHPLLALDLINKHVVKDFFVFQTMLRGERNGTPVEVDYEFWEKDVFLEPGFPQMYFIEEKYAGDPTNWWIPNRACAEAMLRSAGFSITERPEEEVFICRKIMEARHG
ncbi:MAG: TIGR04290 family methyltransferase [Syntrophales bacterium]|nr:TIGR04290 family methyltransferase [Syntrophales bacterium]MDD5232404.1 TIGR04290 family methyltransferase [Syntrophales bacterium]MDD5532204.1 TIGR04290 family methyltransferase [Syntrophales bacterium]